MTKRRRDKKPSGHGSRAFPQSYWADILASVEDAIVVLDARGRVAHLNPAAEQLTGRSEAQAAGAALERLFWGTQWVVEMGRAALSAGRGRSRGEGEVALRGRRMVPVRVTASPVLDGLGSVRGAVLVFQDLSYQRQLEADVERRERLATLGALGAGLAHEIKNPLGGIRGAAQLLARAPEASAQSRECTQVIVREVDRLAGLVERLTSLGPSPLRSPQPVNIHQVLDDVLLLQRQAPGWGEIELSRDYDPSLPPVAGDRDQLVQLFHNLVKNAVEAMGGRGHLRITTRMQTDYHVRRPEGRGRFLWVDVEDDGPGIPEDELPRLFLPFHTTRPGGTGLGLAICHRVASDHGGTIRLEPRARGTCFRITLPVCAEGTAEAEEAAAPAGAAGAEG